MKKTLALAAAMTLFSGMALAEQKTVTMNKISEQGVDKEIGTVSISETEYGVLFSPELEGLPPGLHGFHVHEKPSCQPGEKDGKTAAGMAAGGHYDPQSTGTHKGPYGEGHLGDLPALYVDENGKAQHPVLAPRLKLSDLQGRALMIHKGGDTYSDEPELGGGGGRVACGIIE
jgi:superoxide dismutase, Cu-Zn family